MEKFSYEQNGYSRSDVNQFISEVIVETEKLISVVKKQKLEIAELKKELDHYKSSEGILNNLIITATEANKELKSFVQEEKEEIIISAKNNASKIVNVHIIYEIIQQSILYIWIIYKEQDFYRNIEVFFIFSKGF